MVRQQDLVLLAMIKNWNNYWLAVFFFNAFLILAFMLGDHTGSCLGVKPNISYFQAWYLITWALSPFALILNLLRKHIIGSSISSSCCSSSSRSSSSSHSSNSIWFKAIPESGQTPLAMLREWIIIYHKGSQ